MNPFPTPGARRTLVSALTGACLLSLTAPALAQSAAAWPTKTVRIVVGFAPGGTTDIMARSLAQGLAEALGQPFVVDNKPGASGNISAGEVIKAAPDGYTLLVAPTSVQSANPSLFKASFDPAKDLTPVGGIGMSAMYLVARPGLETKDARELVAMARKSPGKLTYASAGSGTPPHLAGELFKQQAAVSVVHLPYRGAAPALQDVMASQADFVFDPGIAFPHIRSGKVKLLGVVSSKRSPFFPDVPTLAEQGVSGAELDIWFGLWAPNGTPPDVIARLNREAAKVLAQPAIKERFAGLGAEPVSIDQTGFRKLLTDETRTLSSLIRDRGISAD
jgi:tripartite-type tricarboxylate transporter receptor subunit TctC